MQTNRKLNKAYLVSANSTAGIVGPWIRVDSANAVGFAITMTGSQTGTWSLEGTMQDDPVERPPAAGQIVQIVSPAAWAALQPAATAVTALFDYPVSPCITYVRLKYAATSGGASSSTNVQSLLRGV
jgi:hypothetical protein